MRCPEPGPHLRAPGRLGATIRAAQGEDDGRVPVDLALDAKRSPRSLRVAVDLGKTET